jgi:predicted Zn-dependent peptidase
MRQETEGRPTGPWPERVQLSNGLTVVLHPHDAANVAAVQLWVRAGARDEGPDEAGVSHFIEHLLFKGTPSRGPGVIDETISALGGEMNAATSQDWTYYHVVLPAEQLDVALDVLADAAQRAVFDPVEVDRERHVVLEEIRRAEDTPSAALWRVLARGHFGDHAYGRPVLGSANSIAEVPRQAIVAYYRRSYVPNNVTVVVAGSVPAARSLDAVRATFGEWASQPLPARPRRAPRVPSVPGRLEESKALHQTYLGFAWAGVIPPDPEVYALDLVTTVLGQGRSSRLVQSLRERLGLVSAIGSSFYLQHDAGTIAVTARTSTGRYAEVEAAVLAEVARLSEELVTEEELTRAMTAVEAEHAFSGETAEGAAYTLGTADTLWTIEFELGYVDAIHRVTREDMREAARRHLRPDRFTGAVIGAGSPGGGE